jgi:cytoskeletal protein CcmA (bactofilin family)
MWPFRDSKDALPTFEVDNTIGPGSRIRGDLAGPAGFRIDGWVEGGVSADGPVVIGEAGSIEGRVRGSQVVVLGRVRGDIDTTGHLEIGPRGSVLGDVRAKSLRLHEGGVFRGTSRMAGDDILELGEGDIEPVAALPERQERHGGRTLPPPTGAVPPPPRAELAPPPAALPAPSIADDPATSQQRIVARISDPDAEEQETGT